MEVVVRIGLAYVVCAVGSFLVCHGLKLGFDMYFGLLCFAVAYMIYWDKE